MKTSKLRSDNGERSEKPERFSANCDPGLHLRLKKALLDRRQKKQQWLEAAIRHWLRQPAQDLSERQGE